MTLTAACGRFNFDELAAAAEGPAASHPAALELSSECGVLAPPTGALDVTNIGDEPLVIEAVAIDGGFTLVTALPLTIAPASSTALEIRPPIAVIGTDRAGDQRTGTLTLQTNAAIGSSQVALATTIVGANLDLVDTAGDPLTLAFSGTSGACPPPLAGSIKNSGDLPVELQLGAQSGFALTGFTSGTLGSGDISGFSIRPVTSSACSYTGSVTYVVTGSVCSTTPVVLSAMLDITGASTCACS